MHDRQVAGFSSIEVLIALLVLASGAAAFAGLQLSSLQAAREAAWRASGALLATELADWLRGSARMLEQAGALPAFDAPDDAAAGADAACFDAACSPAQMANFEIAHWWRRLLASVPGARLVVCRDSQPWDGHARSWRWTCSASGAADAPLVVKLGWRGPGGDLPLPRLVLPVGPVSP